MKSGIIDQSDYIESAAIIRKDLEKVYGAGYSTAPCRSCGGGCYGCKGNNSTESSSISVSNTGLAKIVESILN